MKRIKTTPRHNCKKKLEDIMTEKEIADYIIYEFVETEKLYPLTPNMCGFAVIRILAELEEKAVLKLGKKLSEITLEIVKSTNPTAFALNPRI